MLKRARSPMMASLSHVALAQLAFFWFSLNPLAAQTACGAKAVVQRGDTLSRIAERCEISEGDLLRANPDVEGSADLRVGMELSLRSPERQLADRVELLRPERRRQAVRTSTGVRILGRRSAREKPRPSAAPSGTWRPPKRSRDSTARRRRFRSRRRPGRQALRSAWRPRDCPRTSPLSSAWARSGPLTTSSRAPARMPTGLCEPVSPCRIGRTRPSGSYS